MSKTVSYFGKSNELGYFSTFRRGLLHLVSLIQEQTLPSTVWLLNLNLEQNVHHCIFVSILDYEIVLQPPFCLPHPAGTSLLK